MTRQMKTITVFDQERYDGEWPPEPALEFLAWFSAKIATIPPEHLAKATIEVGSTSSYDNSTYARIQIHYDRPESDDEMADRTRTNDRERRAKELRERTKYEALKKKFGD